MTLCILGGCPGLVLGAGAAGAVANLAGWPIFLGIDAVMLAVLFATGIGIFFGYYPARKQRGSSRSMRCAQNDWTGSLHHSRGSPSTRVASSVS